MALMSLLTLVFCAACSSAVEDVTGGSTQKQEELVHTKLNFTGEILNITQQPWTRASDGAKDWYVIQVYEDTRSEGATSADYTPYAYGIFDDASNLSLDLVKGKNYKFQVEMLVDASEKVNFVYLGVGCARLKNTFVNSTSDRFLMAPSGVEMINGGTYNRPQIERFYGETEDYTATEGGTVNIDLKRTSFAVNFVAKGFTEGSIKVELEYSRDITMTPETSTVQKVIAMNTSSVAEKDAVPVKITWTKSDGTEVLLASQTITFKRNTLTTIEFTVSEDGSITSGNNIVINVPDDEKTWIDGGTIKLN